jgi:hypothetical protein
VTLVRRLFLVLLVLTIPPLLTAGLYYGTNYLLAATNKVVDPEIPVYAAYIEITLFFIVMLLEAKARW